MHAIIPFRLKTIAFFFLVASTFTLHSKEDKPTNHSTYNISIKEDQIKKALVECLLKVEDSSLYMSAIGANQFPERWAKFVHDIGAETLDGQAIKLKALEGGRWKVFASKGTSIKLRYEVHLDHEDHQWSGGIDGAAYARDWGVFYTGRSIFIMSDAVDQKVNVNFSIPEKWKISCPWDRDKNHESSFSVDNLRSLTDAIFFAGTHEEIVLKREQFQLIFALGGEEVIAQKEAFSKMASGVLDYYIDLMGGVPNPSPDNAFSKSVVVINSSDKTDGEVIGNNISILLEKDGDQMSELIGRFIFAHEFFHLWNGKSFTPAGNDCEWFKEGFTNYYTLKSLFHIGFLNEESYLKVLNDFFYQKYITDDGVGKLSMTDGDQKHDHWGLVYSGGFFIGIAQDMIIRSATDNEKSIDDVLRSLFKKYGGTNDGYSLEEVKKLISEASGKDQEAFFKQYVTGVQPIPLANYLQLGGFKAQEVEKSIHIELDEQANESKKQMAKGFFGIN